MDVTTATPIKRGLKVTGRLDAFPVPVVTTATPIKRGLKAEIPSAVSITILLQLLPRLKGD